MRKGGLEPPRFYPPDPKSYVAFWIHDKSLVFAVSCEDKFFALDLWLQNWHYGPMLLKRGTTWYTRVMFEGVLYQRSLRTKNKSEAIKLEAAFRADLVRGIFGIIDGKQSPTLAEFESRVLPHFRSNVAARTYGFYQQNLAVLQRFPPLAKARLSQIDESLIEKFTQYRMKDGLAIATVNHSLTVLRRVLHVAQEWKLIRDVPRIRLLPGENEREFVLDDAQLAMMTKAIAAAYPKTLIRHLLPFLVDTGLRISEACGLKLADVTFEDGRPSSIKITKGKSKYSKREVPLTHRAADALSAAYSVSQCDYVWTGKGGKKPMTRHYPSEVFRSVRVVAGVEGEAVLHSTRHTFCTRLGKAGIDAFTIQKLAGHSSILISQRYVHADREIKESAIRSLDELNVPKKIVQSDTIKEI